MATRRRFGKVLVAHDNPLAAAAAGCRLWDASHSTPRFEI